MMKKLVSIVLCVFFTFAFCSCGGNKIEETTSETLTTTLETSSETTTTAVTTTVTTAVSTTEGSTTDPLPSATSSVSTTQIPVTSAPETTALPASTTETFSTTAGKAESETVSFTIECKTIVENETKLNPDKKDFVPQDGVIFSGDVPVNENETVFDVLKRLCAENHCKADCTYCKNGIQIEYTFTPAFNTYYVEGIHQLYEFDCGSTSGWVYSVNGVSPEVGCSSYPAKAGDVIVFSYVI